MPAFLCTLFFASGASALIFETLWFRQAGLAFGNSVWASSLVLSAFMGGLALGNAIAARYGARIPNAIRVYAIAEGICAFAGVGLVYLFPVLGVLLAPLLRPLLEHPWALNALRLLLAFGLLLVPSTAVGLTLPVVVKTLMGRDPNFGRALGRLYGWNTLGGVAGVVIGETYLVGAYGVRGTALLAGALNATVAAVAMWLSTRTQSRGLAGLGPHPQPRTGGGRWLAAAGVSGFCLLALEVVWFRFLVLFVKGHSTAFPLMLAVVLSGIALGGLAASMGLRVRPASGATRDRERRGVATVAFLAAIACVVSYATFPLVIEPLGLATITRPREILRVAIPLMLPVSLLSGVFFTLVGAALRSGVASEIEAAGLLTLANTTGAAAGSLTAGFVLLPLLGMERSFFAIAVVYGALGVLLLVKGGEAEGTRPTRATMAAPRVAVYATAGLTLVSLALFPFGSLERRLLPIPLARWAPVEAERRVVGVREGLTETVIYFERLVAGKPVSHVMLTNSFSMSTTGYGVRRYQKLYVYWPMAVHPNLRRVLLIGYGVGNTAKAMTDTPGIQSIDVVDLSRDILAMNRLVYPNEAALPLHDPRVRVHIEDGRYYLQTTAEQFDLITGEPPPPGIAGVENLYTREYFRLLHGRLAEGGFATYWLPLSDLTDVSAKAILRAFCDAFEDCSLWNGSGMNLMMVGSRHARGPVSETVFRRQWGSQAGAELTRLGIERPEQLGALFIGDAAFARTLTAGAAPLTDDDPKLIEAGPSSADAGSRLIASVTDVAAASRRFESSALVARLWPDPLRVSSVPYFELQRVIDDHMYGDLVSQPPAIEDVHLVLTRSPLVTPVLWRLASNSDIQSAVSAATPTELANPLLQFHLGIRQLAERDYDAAADALGRAEQLPEISDNAFVLHVYALCMAGRTQEAEDMTKGPFRQALGAGGVSADSVKQASLPPLWLWMKDTFGIDPRN